MFILKSMCVACIASNKHQYKKVASKKNVITKSDIEHAIQRAVRTSKLPGKDHVTALLWERVDDLTLQFYDENEGSAEVIQWLYQNTEQYN
jgi:hypothetical protein